MHDTFVLKTIELNESEVLYPIVSLKKDNTSITPFINYAVYYRYEKFMQVFLPIMSAVDRFYWNNK